MTLACIAPGSRSTPLVAAAARHTGLTKVTHVDERGAAFFCLGHARVTGKPALWITTSGTAVANGLPAVVEASADLVPLICLTADRPPELRGTGANQTIRQTGIFGGYPRLAMDLGVPDQDGRAASPSAAGPTAMAGSGTAGPTTTGRFTGAEVALAAYRAAIGVPAGPVHLNLQFRKPLEPTPAQTAKPLANDAPPPASAIQPHSQMPSPVALQELANALADKQNGVILAGRMDRETAAAVLRLADKLNWPVLPDICSQLRLGGRSTGQLRAGKSTLLVTHADLQAGRGPEGVEAVVQIGRMPVSQRLTRWLAAQAPQVWAVVADGTETIDPHQVATHRLNDGLAATEALTDALQNRDVGSWTRKWIDLQARVERALPDVLERGPFPTEPAVARLVADGLQDSDALVLASSMPVRDVNTFAGAGQPPALVISNRGASGIDGTIATAAGVAAAIGPTGGRTILLIGDLAFLHDLNSLALIRERNVTIIVINNDGGGIFSFLPIAAHSDLFEPYFGVSHGLNFASAAQLYGLRYAQPAARVEFESALREAGPVVIEVKTDREQNVREHQRLGQLVDSWLS